MAGGYLDLNRASWDERAPADAASADYAVQRFVDDPSFLSHVVRFDLPRLGDIAGLHAVHLQCHIGTDTVSLARLGARMTGLDFSAVSLQQARRLSDTTGAGVTWVHSELYRAQEVLGEGAFDLVYTGVGALCWLPSIRRWATVVAALLAPGGRLFIREAHPMLWSIDERRTDGMWIDLPYFERPEPYVDEDSGTYVATDAGFTHNLTHTWNHGLGEAITALHEAGLALTHLAEHDSVPWNALPGQMERDELGEWRLIDRPWRLAASYTLQAVRR